MNNIKRVIYGHNYSYTVLKDGSLVFDSSNHRETWPSIKAFVDGHLSKLLILTELDELSPEYQLINPPHD